MITAKYSKQFDLHQSHRLRSPPSGYSVIVRAGQFRGRGLVGSGAIGRRSVRGSASEPVPLDRIQYCAAILREYGLDLREVLEHGLGHL
jgi:hypothetical protein